MYMKNEKPNLPIKPETTAVSQRANPRFYVPKLHKKRRKGQRNVPEQLQTVEVMMKTAGVTTGGPDTALYKRSCEVTEKRFGRAA